MSAKQENIARSTPRHAERPAGQTGNLTAVTFNGWVGQGRQDGTENVEELLEDTQRPHIGALQEAHWLDPIAGYRRHRAEGEDLEDRNIVLLIREDLTVHRSGLLEIHHRRWVGPKHGLTHGPRIMPFAEVSLPGERARWCILDVHRITSTHGRNEVQRHLELEQLDSWLTAHAHRHPRRPIVALGDWNGQPHALAHAHDGELTLVDVDGALTINATVEHFHERHRRYGSDSHHPVAFTIARKAHR